MGSRPRSPPAYHPESRVSVHSTSPYQSTGLLGPPTLGNFGGARLLTAGFGLDYAGLVANSPVPSHTSLVEPRNPNFSFGVDEISVVGSFGLFPLYSADERTPAVLSAPVPQQRQFSESIDDANFGMPDWIVFIKPHPPRGEQVITFRRETHVAFDIIYERLPSQFPPECSGIKIPSTRSVKKSANMRGKTLLELYIHVYGATTKENYETVCENCEKREKRTKGVPNLIDFHAQYDVIEPKDGKIRVDFSFCCYPKCHKLGDTEYLVEVILSEDVGQRHTVAQYQLPLAFKVLPRIRPPKSSPATGKLSPTPTNGKRNQRYMEQSDDLLPPVKKRNIRPRSAEPPQRNPPSNESINYPLMGANYRDIPQGGQNQEAGSPPPITPPSAANPVRPPNQMITLPRTDSEHAVTLTEVNPDLGSVTGGARIWLRGVEFPTHFPLYARFGTAVVPTTFSNPFLLVCILPSATTPGSVKVTLSKSPHPSAPDYGTSLAKFQYLGDHDQLIPILLRIQGHGHPEFSPVLQALLTMINGPQTNLDRQGGRRIGGEQEDPIETGLMEALSCLQERPNFHEIVSTTNDYNQTLAHLSISYDYPSLLSRLLEWGVDLTIADGNGLTALHCAYMKGDLDSVRNLRRCGAPETVKDALGRTPSDLRPEGFDLGIDLGAEVASGLGSDVQSQEDDIDEQVALGEQFNALHLDGDNDSVHSQSDFDSYVSDTSTAVNSFTSGGEGCNPGGGSGYGKSRLASCFEESAINTMNQLPLERNKQRRKKNHGPRMLPDTPYDPAISCISKKLREANAEPEAVDFLTSRVFPDGIISLISLKTEMTPLEVAEFHGTLKYHGLLRRNEEIAYCRLCPEDSQLDFKDPEGALYHMTKDHFEMGYSCDCGCEGIYRTSADWRRHRRRNGLSQTVG